MQPIKNDQNGPSGIRILLSRNWHLISVHLWNRLSTFITKHFLQNLKNPLVAKRTIFGRTLGRPVDWWVAFGDRATVFQQHWHRSIETYSNVAFTVDHNNYEHGSLSVLFLVLGGLVLANFSHAHSGYSSAQCCAKSQITCNMDYDEICLLWSMIALEHQHRLAWISFDSISFPLPFARILLGFSLVISHSICS